jgi:hypothetical protein
MVSTNDLQTQSSLNVPIVERLEKCVGFDLNHIFDAQTPKWCYEFNFEGIGRQKSIQAPAKLIYLRRLSDFKIPGLLKFIVRWNYTHGQTRCLDRYEINAAPDRPPSNFTQARILPKRYVYIGKLWKVQ